MIPAYIFHILVLMYQIVVINKERKSRLNSKRLYTTFYWAFFTFDYTVMFIYFIVLNNVVSFNLIFPYFLASETDRKNANHYKVLHCA